MTREEWLELAISKIKPSKKFEIKLTESVYKNALEFMRRESDLQYKMDYDEFEYLKEPYAACKT